MAGLFMAIVASKLEMFYFPFAGMLARPPVQYPPSKMEWKGYKDLAVWGSRLFQVRFTVERNTEINFN